MNEFEKDLRAALRRENAPSGFTDRVLEKIRPRPAHLSKWIGIAIAAGLILVGGLLEYRRYEGQKAKRELLFALELAGNKLSIAQQKIFELNRRTIHERE